MLTQERGYYCRLQYKVWGSNAIHSRRWTPGVRRHIRRRPSRRPSRRYGSRAYCYEQIDMILEETILMSDILEKELSGYYL